MDNIKMTKLDSPELSRTYNFPGGDNITVHNVTHIAVRPSGNHRLIIEGGELRIIKGHWLSIDIVGSVPHFVL